MKERETVNLRAFFIGALLSLFISIAIPYGDMVIRGSAMAADFSTAAAIFLFFILVGGINTLLKLIKRSLALNSSELLLVYIMMIVACALPSMGLTEYWLSTITAPYYYASPENRWVEILQPHLRSWLSPQSPEGIRCFYEGLPRGEGIPFAIWIKPLLLWSIFLFSLYFVMICMMVILRKQWMEKERLIYPLTYLPLEMVKKEEDNSSIIPPFFKNKLMWLGFSIPFIIGCINGLHSYFHFIPSISLGQTIPIFRNTTNLKFNLSFPMLGFAYLINLNVAFSLWFFNLLAKVITGFRNITGFAMTEHLLTSSARNSPINAHIGMGAMLTLVLFGLWVSREHLKGVFKKAVKKEPGIDDSNEILSYRVAFWGMLIGLLVMGIWLNQAGLSFWTALILLFGVFILFIGVTRIVVESGLAAVRSTMCGSSFLVSGVGSRAVGPVGLSSLLFTYVWAVDIRTFVMASAAHGLKIGEKIKRKRVLFWAMMTAIAISMIGSVWMVLKLAYTYGGLNADTWYFQAGPIQGIEFVTHFLRHPAGANIQGWVYTGLGAGFMLFLMFMHTHFLWWPLHPIGFPISSVWIMDVIWFTIFLSWLVKSLILRYGGPKLYRNARPFFLGLILGQFTVSGLWLIIDFFTKKTGNFLFWM